MLMVLVYVGYALMLTPYGPVDVKVCVYKPLESVYTKVYTEKVIYHLPWQICATYRNV